MLESLTVFVSLSIILCNFIHFGFIYFEALSGVYSFWTDVSSWWIFTFMLCSIRDGEGNGTPLIFLRRSSQLMFLFLSQYIKQEWKRLTFLYIMKNLWEHVIIPFLVLDPMLALSCPPSAILCQHRISKFCVYILCIWRRQWQPTPVFLPGESQGQGSLVGCCLWGLTESDTTEVT